MLLGSCFCADLMFVRVMDEVSCRGCGGAEEDVISGEMRGCHSATAGRETGPWLRGEEAELTECLNREMRQASLNYKQQVWIRRGIRSTTEHGIRGRRARKKKDDFN